MPVATTAPSTPENSYPHHVMRRAFTAPPRPRASATTDASDRVGESTGAETLFALDNCRIVSFTTTRTSPTRRHSSVIQSDLQDAPVGTLPWVYATERAVAAGMSRSTFEILPLRLTVSCRAATHTPFSWRGGFSTHWRITGAAAPDSAKISVLVRGWRVEICYECCSQQLLPN